MPRGKKALAEQIIPKQRQSPGIRLALHACDTVTVPTDCGPHENRRH